MWKIFFNKYIYIYKKLNRIKGKSDNKKVEDLFTLYISIVMCQFKLEFIRRGSIIIVKSISKSLFKKN
jgi:hypothetical protein